MATSMSPRPSRHFGTPSRAANSYPYKKSEPASPSKFRITDTKPDLNLLLNREPVKDVYRDCATVTHPLSTLDLSLPPFKVEHDHYTLLDPDSLPEEFMSDTFVDEDALEDEEGMPTRAQWKALVDKYMTGLHPNKRDKALITQRMHEMIFRTLKDPDATRLGTPQFRFWARKMFQLVEAAGVLVITNGGRPVAVKEHIYDILCMCHAESGHAGRDKTCKILREYYTWIPKELTASFVKTCPTCIQKRSGESTFLEKNLEVLDDVPLAKQLHVFRRDQSQGDHSQFFVERIEDFGRVPSSYMHSQMPLVLPQNTFSLCTSDPPRRDSLSFGNNNILGSPLSHKLALARLPPSDESFPIPSWTNNLALPPLNNSKSDKSKVKVENAESGRMTLPPLMQYLSQDFDDDLQIRKDRHDYSGQRSHAPSPAENIPIDPALLAEETSQCHSSEYSCGAYKAPTPTLELQLHPPTTQHQLRHSVPSPLDLSLAQSNGVSADGSFSSYGGGEDNALLSASSESTGVCTPSSGRESFLGYVSYEHVWQEQHGHGCSHAISKEVEAPLVTPLYSPVPVKFEDTSTMLQLAATSSLDGDEP